MAKPKQQVKKKVTQELEDGTTPQSDSQTPPPTATKSLKALLEDLSISVNTNETVASQRCIWNSNGKAFTYNDVLSVEVTSPFVFEGGIEARSFKIWSQSIGDQTPTEGSVSENVLFSVGRNKFTTGIQAPENSPFEWPATPPTSLPITEEFVKALRQGMTSIDSSSLKGKTSFVTMSIGEFITFYSTNQNTITKVVSEYACKDKSIRSDYLLPISFCNALLKMVYEPTEERLAFGDNFLVLYNNSRRLFTRLGTDAHSLDYESVISGIVERFTDDSYFLVPEKLEDDLKLRSSMTTDRTVTTTFKAEDKVLNLDTEYTNNQITNCFDLEEKFDATGKYYAHNVLRGLSLGEFMVFDDSTMVIVNNPRYLYLVSAI